MEHHPCAHRNVERVLASPLGNYHALIANSDRTIGNAVELVPEDQCVVLIALEQIHCLLICLLYTSDAADERSSVDLGGRRIIKKKK